MTIPTPRLSSRHLTGETETEPTDILIIEHRVTEQALNCLERMAERWTGPGVREAFDHQAVGELVVFFQTFVEAWHFRREEAYFSTTGVDLENAVLYGEGNGAFHDHERCSVHLRGIERAIADLAQWRDAEAAESQAPAPMESEAYAFRPAEVQASLRAFGEHARAYADILLKHIEDEEDFTYPAIERRVTPAGKSAAQRAFHAASCEGISAHELDECLRTVGRLASRFGVLPR
ncbi:MAG: hypothetical protein U1E05_03310 [Patescibacteria group bacterium]|nr:hypothetical protein [Patescibacteria group bacterium]